MVEPLTKKRKLAVNDNQRSESENEHLSDGEDEEERPLLPWESRATEAISLELVGPTGTGKSFAPTFAYPIFGTEEVIYGYRDLEIKLSHSAASLFTCLKISHTEEVNPTQPGCRPADHVHQLLKKHLPPDFTEDRSVFLQHVQQDAVNFCPMGEKIDSYSFGEEGVTYELYSANFETPGFLSFHQRLQVFLLWFIEGASYIELDSRWETVLLFQRREANGRIEWAIVGFMTYYPFFSYQPGSLDEKRNRISQFLILPPFQRRGHGGKLYSTMFKIFLNQPDVLQITVEDPNEQFDLLRDHCDLVNLIQRGADKGLALPLDAAAVTAFRVASKLSERQSHRCLEMLLLRNMRPSDIKANRLYRLHVKRRIFRFNEEALKPLNLSRVELMDKLEQTFESVVEGYAQIIAGLPATPR
ncbi:histone acetyltransferase 1 [Thoreauomyces humboldtii]|nr:histone acetyltransferase 1 [Thoreauomyces humboldtii]